MDDVVNRFARELADAIAAAVAQNPQVEACREKARAAGFEMKVTLEAIVGFVNRGQAGAPAASGAQDSQGTRSAQSPQVGAMTKVTAPARPVRPSRPAREVPSRRTFEVTANDRRFLRSLRIAADETAEPVE
jgi:hypothetical protein